MKRSGVVIAVLVAIPFIILDVALFLAGKFQVQAVVTMIAVFAICIGIYWLRRIRGGKVEKDERTIKLARKAAHFSWLISFFIVAFLSGCDTLGVIHLTGAQCLTIVMMVMTFSYLILLFITNRRGDAE